MIQARCCAVIDYEAQGSHQAKYVAPEPKYSRHRPFLCGEGAGIWHAHTMYGVLSIRPLSGRTHFSLIINLIKNI